MVVSVPSIIRCLSLSETTEATVLVGAPDTTAALVIKAFGLAWIGFQENVFLFLFVAINCSPKLSRDQDAGSSTTVEVLVAEPHPEKLEASVTVTELLCAVAVVPDAPLDAITMSLLDIEL